MSAIEIAVAEPHDLPAITEIYNDVIATTTAVFALAPTSEVERRSWIAAREAAGYPVLVARSAGTVVGFGSFGEFRGVWPGYRYSVEHSVHVHTDFRGRGIGSAIVRRLLAEASAMGKHVMIGGIDATNVASLRMHERLGFDRVAHLHEVGHKFGRWLDLILVQRFLDGAGAHRD